MKAKKIAALCLTTLLLAANQMQAVEPDCGTAYAYGEKKFNETLGGDPWQRGWQITVPGSSSFIAPIYANVEKNKVNSSTTVGTLSVSYKDSLLKVVFAMLDGYVMNETSFYVGDKKAPTTAHGQYSKYHHADLNGSSADSYELDVSSYDGETLYLAAAQAAVCAEEDLPTTVEDCNEKPLSWQGAWQETQIYAAGSIVQHSGTSYVNTCCESIEGVEPERDPAPVGCWDLLAAKGEQGLTGPAGPQGIEGEAGPKGDTGDTGPQGPQGEIGPQGIQGNIGPQGATGDTGAVGPAGPAGPQGLKGDKGDTGLQGIQGEVGPQGEIGPQGIQGDTGAKGDTGLTGPAGPQGIQGAAGLKGDKGDTGAAGPKGDAGLTGAKGDTGAAGPAGPQGAKGDKGDIGLTGPAGPQGIQGAAGLKGDKGDTGAAGPKGDTGPQGTQGEIGPQGIQGDTGAKGDTGLTGPAGPKGDTGLTGAKGDTGAAGPAGPQGIQGNTGDTGAAGPAGPQGAKGDTGPQGIQGKAGPQGVTGPQGIQGPAGPQGIQGPAGICSCPSTSSDLSLSSYFMPAAPAESAVTATQCYEGDFMVGIDENGWIICRDAGGSCRTAFAYGQTELADILPVNLWGWQLTLNQGQTLKQLLYTSASENDLSQAVKVGELTASYLQDKVTVTFNMTAEAAMSATHLYAGETNVGTALPSQYGNAHEGLNRAVVDSYEVKVSGAADSLKIVAHAVVCDKK